MSAENIRASIAAAELVLPKSIQATDIGTLLAMKIPPREFLLRPVIPEQGLAMVYSKRGVGKTHVGLGMAYAVATGGKFLKCEAPGPRKVLYLDGEMPASAMQERLAQIVQSAELEPPDPSYFRLVTPDLQDIPMPDIGTAEGQAEIEPLLEGVSLVVVDNLSTLARSGKENEGEGWLSIQAWALGLRRRGISILFVHHAAKGGQQRGTSRREDVLDTVVKLENPSDYHPEEGARFEIHFEKSRGIMGDEVRPFEARLVGDEWTFRDVEDANYLRVVELSKEGNTVRDIAEDTGMSKSAVNRMQKKAKANGEID